MSVSTVTCRGQMMLRRLVAPVFGCQCPHQLQLTRGKRNQHLKGPKKTAAREIWLPRSARQKAKQTTKPWPVNLDKFLERKPVDDVWIKMYYPPMKYSAAEALEMHREVACPEMTDNMEAFVHLNMALTMSTNKKTKFVAAFNGLLVMPYDFDDGTINKVLAFCRTKEEAKVAIEQGATFAGGASLVAQLQSGDIRSYMFDHAVCTADFYDEISKARKHMREKFPNKRTGAVGPDLELLILKYKHGKNYACTKDYDDYGSVNVRVGKLDMPTEHLVENISAYIARMNSHRPLKGMRSGVRFLSQAYLTCPPSQEKIYLSDLELTAEETTKFTPALEEPTDTAANAAL